MKLSNSLTLALLTAAATLIAACGGGEQRQVIQNKGSDTLVNVAQAWAEAYQVVNPSVVVAVSGGGSGTGIAALINGTVDLANASRAIKDKETKLARDNGQNPIQHVVGFDALAVFLHGDNPLDEISIEQLAGIYGEEGNLTTWTDLGVEVPGCQDQEIVVVSRQNNSGTYVYFRETVLGDGDFRLGTRDMHGSKDVVDLVEKTPCAIGYSGLAYATDHIKLACVSMRAGEACVSPSVSTAVDGSYPIARPLFMYTNGEPTGVVGEYLNWIKSNEGQCIILNKGYAPATKVNCG
ncbi:MAG: PstS family phosphate ABC transporter substrate-binding protein [Gammaproteobacteria bacterium]|nr:PstS family phosphate ABC transporter substrate-binding protein [Gammaproteobacteria bacterium]